MSGSSYTAPTEPSGDETLAGSSPGGVGTVGPADAIDPVDAIPQPGEAVGPFVVERVLGAGAMGVVLYAHDPELARPVAIKLLAPRLGGNDRARQRLIREAQAIARLSHPNVIAVHQAGVHGGRVYVVMELVDGGTLRQWAAAQPRSWREIVEVYRQAAEGLAAAHAAGLVHRDFKPDNALIGRDGRVRVSDFGLVAPSGEQSEGSTGTIASDADVRLTQTGAVMGTPAYMSPEQFAGHRVDARADQFAFCVALHEALHGERPFRGDNAMALYAGIEAGRARPPRRADVPAPILTAISRGLRADPAGRHPSMAVLSGQLAAALASPRAGRGLAIGLGIGIGALAVGGAGLALTWDGKEPGAEGVAVGGDETPADEACPLPDGTLEGRWTTTQHATLDRMFVGSGLAAAADRAGRTRRAVDAYVAALGRGTQALCRAASSDDAAIEPALVQARARCLHDATNELHALLELFSDAPAVEVVDSGMALVAALPQPAACEDEAYVRARPSIATTDEDDARWRRRRRAYALLQVERFAEAREEGSALREEAETLGQAALEAESLVVTARARRLTGEHAAAELDLVQAIGRAQAAGDPIAEWHARRERLATVASTPGRAADAKLLVDGTELAFDRAAAVHEGWELHAALAELHAANGDFVAALLELEDAAHGLESLPIARADQLGLLHVHRGTLLQMLGRFPEAEAAYRLGLAVQTQALGLDHPAQAFGLERTIGLLQQLGRFDEMLVHAARLVAVLEARGGDHATLARALKLRGDAELSHHEPARAADSYARALAIFSARDDANAETVATALGLGHARFMLGEIDTADEALERAQTIAAAEPAVHAMLGAEIASLRGTIAFGRERPHDARRHYQAALRIRETTRGPGPEVIEAHLVLAELAVAMGACEDGAEHVAAAAKIQGTAAARRGDFLVRTALAQAQCAIETGALDAARRSLDEADGHVLREHLDPMFASNVTLVRAKLAFHEGDRARATELATSARDALAALGSAYAGQRAIADTFVEKYGTP